MAKELCELYAKYGANDYIGENVTQLEHALQCGYFASKKACDKELIVSSVIHDCYHLVGMQELDTDVMGNYGMSNHAEKGGEYLKKKGFTDRVCKLVASHVLAKKYLVTINEEYEKKLSDASKKTLVYQKGKMTLDELKTFESDPDKDAIILLRSFDDQAKLKNFKVPPMETYIDLMNDCIMTTYDGI